MHGREPRLSITRPFCRARLRCTVDRCGCKLGLGRHQDLNGEAPFSAAESRHGTLCRLYSPQALHRIGQRLVHRHRLTFVPGAAPFLGAECGANQQLVMAVERPM